MKCSIEGCGRNARYKSKQLCQMHYFRLWRNGTVELKPKGYKYRQENPQGYQYIYEPDHALAITTGYVSEHRYLIYEKYGMNLPDCEICGKPTDWKTCHIDHIDNNPRNNNIDNLRPLCRGCNTFRDYPAQHTLSRNHSITYDGLTMTATEWARDPRIKVSGSTIVLRIKRGMSVYDALFSDKVTHNGKPKTDNRIRKTNFKHERSNAVAVTIEGVTQTANEWARHPLCTVTANTIVNRVRSNWNHSEAVFTPARSQKKKATP